MNTLSNAYLKKISSGTILALLLISAFAFVAPAILTAKAAPAQFSANFTYPYVIAGAGGVDRDINITNPLGNPGITEIDVNFPLASATGVGAPACGTPQGFLTNDCGAVSGSGPWTEVAENTVSSGATILAQGSSGQFVTAFGPEASESVAGTVDTYTLTIRVYYTDGSTQTGTLTLYEGSATKVTTALTTTTPATVGSSVGFTATMSGGAGPGGSDTGVPLSFVSAPTVAKVISAGFSASFAPTSGKATGTPSALSTVFVSTEAGSYTATADAGTASVWDDGPMLTAVVSGAVALSAGAPTRVVVGTPYDSTGHSIDYVDSAVGVAISLTLADSYGNAVTAAAADGTATFTVAEGTLSVYTGTVTNGALVTVIKYTPLTTTGAYLAYGTYDLISASLVVPTPSTLAGTYTGSSNELSIGYLNTGAAIPVPTITRYLPSVGGTPTTGPGNVVAGSTVGLSVTLPGVILQAGVPFNFSITTAISGTPYTGTFSNGLGWMIVTTNSNGVAAANFTSDTTTGHEATAMAVVSEPESTPAYLPSNKYSTAATGDIITTFGTGIKLVALTYSTSPCTTQDAYVKPSGVLYVSVSLADQYGNPITNLLGFALQVSLSYTGGGLSSTTVYVTQGFASTCASGYVVQFTAPSTLGTVTIGATTTQPGISSGTTTVYIVNDLPIITITAPTTTGSTIATQTIAGFAVRSPAYTSSTFIVSFKYSLNGAANVSTPITSTNSTGAAFFSFPVTMVSGSNTVKVYATDTNGNVGVATLKFTISPPVTIPNTFQSSGSGLPTSTTVSGFPGVSTTLTNFGTTSVTAQFWIQFTGPTTLAEFQGSTVASGGSTTVFFGTAGLAPGSYTATVYASVGLTPYSSSYSVTFTVP